MRFSPSFALLSGHYKITAYFWFRYASPEGNAVNSSDVADKTAPLTELYDFTDIENQAPSAEIVEETEEQEYPEEPPTTSPSVNEPTTLNEFRLLANLESSRLSSNKAAWEDVMEEEGDSIPDIALNSIRVAVGKCGLMLTKKFPFFASLIDLAEESQAGKSSIEENLRDDEPKPGTGLNDLLGMWEIIANEIADIDGAFGRLRRWRDVSAWAMESRPKTPARFGGEEKEAQHKKPAGSRLPRATRKSTLLTPTVSSKLKAVAAQKPLKVSRFIVQCFCGCWGVDIVRLPHWVDSRLKQHPLAFHSCCGV